MEVVRNKFGLFFYFVLEFYGVDGHWINDYDYPVNFSCHRTNTISYWRSIHSTDKHDRIFDLGCGFLEQATALSPSCSWTDYVNSWDEAFDFHCPNNGYINGYYSIHNNDKEDRIMKFRCCTLPGMCVLNCRRTGWANDYHKEVLDTVPVAQVLYGVKSEHDNQMEDRRWDFKTCFYQRC